MRYGTKLITREEINELVISWIGVSLAFAIGRRAPLPAVPQHLITVGIGFLVHELGHKVAAYYYGVAAYYESNKKMIIAGIITSIFGIIFLAPGAVRIIGSLTKKESGVISAAGPLSNGIIAIIFLSANALMPSHTVLLDGAYINLLLLLFNMVPLPPLDGFKVWRWSKVAYAGMIAVGLTPLAIMLG